MAEKIEPGAPRPPQHRVQRMDEHGNFVPVPEEPQPPKQPAPPPSRPFTVGEQVMLSGRVLEVQSPQGGQTSVKVQLDHSGGAAWFRGEHITHPAADEREKQAEADTARIAELEMQVQDLQRQVTAAQVREEQQAVKK